MVACDGDCCQWFHTQCTDYKVKKGKVVATVTNIDQLNNILLPHCHVAIFMYVCLYYKKKFIILRSFSLTCISFFKVIMLCTRSCSVYYMYMCVCIS